MATDDRGLKNPKWFDRFHALENADKAEAISRAGSQPSASTTIWMTSIWTRFAIAWRAALTCS